MMRIVQNKKVVRQTVSQGKNKESDHLGDLNRITNGKQQRETLAAA